MQAMYLMAAGGGNLYPPAGTPHMPDKAAKLIGALMFYGSPFYACLVCTTLLALTLRSDPMHATAAWLLSRRPFRLAATLLYSVYLLHEMVKLGFLAAFPAILAPTAVARAPVAALAKLVGGTLLTSYAAGVLTWYLVERRF
jgi:peptidoglycan/LPS O-acetylase OafA/YrhL